MASKRSRKKQNRKHSRSSDLVFDIDNIKKDLERNIQEAVSLLRKHHPLHYLARVFLRYGLVTEEERLNNHSSNNEAILEYAHSLALSVKEHGATTPSHDELEKFVVCCEEIVTGAAMFHMLRAKSSNVEDETMNLGLMRHIVVRGAGMEAHETDLIRSIFNPHDNFFKENNLLTAEEFIEFCDLITKKLLSAIEQQRLQAIKIFNEIVKQSQDDASLNIEELLLERNKIPSASEDVTEELLNLFRVKVTQTEHSVCLRMAAELGDDGAFLEFAKAPGWPGNDTVITSRPLVLLKDEFYVFNPTLLFRRRFEILENLIRGINASYYQKNYAKSRGKIAEQLAVRYVRQMLPTSKVYQSVYYRIFEDGLSKRCEADAIIVLDGYLLLLEVKSAPLSMKAMRGADVLFNKEIKHLIKEPHGQALRTLSYLKNNQEAVFEGADGSEVVTVKRDEFREVYIINVTLAEIGYVSVRMNAMHEQGFITDRPWPWSVYVNDLRMMAEIIESPSEFLLYLQHRLKANEISNLMSTDEMDYFGRFLLSGKLFDSTEVNKFDKILFDASESIERYFEHLAGIGRSVEKPRLRSFPWFREMIFLVEKSGKKDCLYVAKSLLSVDLSLQEDAFKWFTASVPMAATQPKSFSVIPRDLLSPCLLLSISCAGSKSCEDTLRQLARRKVLQTGRELIWVVIDSSLDSATFEILDCTNVKSSFSEEEALDFYRMVSYGKAVQEGKIGVNLSCPCKSGLKFKRCCLARSEAWK